MEPSKGFLNYEINYHYYLGPYLREREKNGWPFSSKFSFSVFIIVVVIVIRSEWRRESIWYGTKTLELVSWIAK